MTYTTLNQYNISGQADQILVYINYNLPLFIPIVLTAFCLIITSSLYFGTRRFYGSADFWSCFAVGTFLTLLVAISMSLTVGIITNTTLVILTVIVFATFIVMTLKSKGE